MNEKQADTLLNVPEIVKRAKIALNLKRDSELASYLGVARATLSNWCARNSIDFPLLLNKLRHVDYNWLLTGKGSPLHDPKSFDNGKIRGEVETIHNSKTTEAIDDRSVTLYDITAAANLRTLLSDKRQYALGKILIPSIPACDGAIFVNGDSMYPILKSGDIVQGDQQLQQRHLRRNVHRGVPPRRRPVSDGEIRQPLGEGRVRQTRQLQSAPRADGLACRHHSGYGNSEVLHQKEYDDVKTAQAKQAFSTDFLSHFFLKSVESIIFARCKPYLCTLQAVKS